LRTVQGIESRLSLRRDVAVLIFPKAKKKEGNCGGDDQEFGFARYFDFWLPSKELRGQKKSEGGPEGERTDLNTKLPNGSGTEDGALQSLNEVSSRQKQRDVLHDFGQKGQGKGSARKKNQGEPEKLVDDLSFLHGVGDAGHDETQRRERNGADADQDEGGEQVSKLRYVKDIASEKEFDENGGKHEHVIGNNAGG